MEKKFKKSLFLNGTIKAHFLFLYLIFIMIPILVFLSVIYGVFSRKIVEYSLDLSENLIAQAGTNISFDFQKVEDISKSICSNSDIRKILESGEKNVWEDYLDVTKMREFLYNFAEITKDMEIKIYINPKKMYSSEEVIFYSYDNSRFDLSEIGQNKLSPKIEWNLETAGEYMSKTKLPSRIVYDVPIYGIEDVTEATAYIEVAIPYKKIENVVQDIGLSTDSEYYLVDEHGEILVDAVSMDTCQFDTQKFLSIVQDEKCVSFKIGNMYYAYARIDPSGWGIVCPIQLETVISQDDYFGMLIVSLFVFAVVFLIVIFCAICWITNYYDTRIAEIAENLKKADLDEIEKSIQKETVNLNKLAENTSKLILKVHTLAKKNMEAELNEKKAELKLLQWQINPHFLYNALDTVNWAAIKRNDKDTSKMINLIAKYFRLVLGNGDSNIHLSEELDFCRTYLEIQKEINPNKFSFEIDNEGMLIDIVLPKMSVQPLVENALIHGVLKNRVPGMIRIRVEQTSDRTDIVVWNSGSEIDVSKINYKIRPKESKGYALYNVFERLKIYFGEESELKFFSDSYGVTAKIIIKI